MQPAATAAIADPASQRLELATGLSAIAAGVLWFQVYLANLETAALCSSESTLLDHCPACGPAVVATLAALVCGILRIDRRGRA